MLEDRIKEICNKSGMSTFFNDKEEIYIKIFSSFEKGTSYEDILQILKGAIEIAPIITTLT